MWKVAGSAAIAALMAVGTPAAVMAQGSAGQATGMGVAAAPRLSFSEAEMALARATADSPALAAFYGANGLKRIFDGDVGAARQQALAAAVAQAPAHGIPAGRYGATQPGDGSDLAAEVHLARVLAQYLGDLTGGVIRPTAADDEIHRVVRRAPVSQMMTEFAASPNPAGYLAGLLPDHPAYLALQSALAQRSGFVVPAHLPKAPEAVWRVGMRGAGVVPLRDRLASIGFGATGGGDLYDAALSDSVAAYQKAVGLTDDGVAGPRTIRALNADGDEGARKIAVALERMRWMSGDDLSARHVWVNIPEYTARIFEGGQQVFETRTVVGKDSADMRTPEFSDIIQYVVVNPSWNVPPSMAARDYLPKLRANRHAVAHLDVVDRNGRVVPRDRIDFSKFSGSNFPYRLRQKPSDDNALGLVKFIFPNKWNIYLHDTPSKGLFRQANRAHSNGCIRIGDPFDLAYQLLSRQTDNPEGMFRRALDRKSETWLKLGPGVPIHLVYFTAWPDQDGNVRFHDDIYGRDARIWDRLAKAGLDSRGQWD